MRETIERLRDYFLCALALGANPKAASTILWKECKNIRARLHLERYNPREVYCIQTTYGPLYFRDNFGDITNLVQLFYHNVYRIEPLRYPGIILDIGANIGLAATLYGYHNPDKTIFCFEPLVENIAMIELNCPSAQARRVALGARSGRVTLRVDRDHVMASSIPCAWETRDVEFDVTTLDDFTDVENLKEVAIMKIDTEGMEVEILKGGQNTLDKTRQLVMESHSRPLHSESIIYLREAGFHIESETFKNKTGLIFASHQ